MSSTYLLSWGLTFGVSLGYPKISMTCLLLKCSVSLSITAAASDWCLKGSESRIYTCSGLMVTTTKDQWPSLTIGMKIWKQNLLSNTWSQSLLLKNTKGNACGASACPRGPARPQFFVCASPYFVRPSQRRQFYIIFCSYLLRWFVIMVEEKYNTSFTWLKLETYICSFLKLERTPI